MGLDKTLYVTTQCMGTHLLHFNEQQPSENACLLYQRFPLPATPGPLPATPTVCGGSMINFCSPPLISPAKPFRGPKPTPLSFQEGYSAGQNFSTMNYPQAVLAGWVTFSLIPLCYMLT